MAVSGIFLFFSTSAPHLNGGYKNFVLEKNRYDETTMNWRNSNFARVCAKRWI